MDCWLCGAIATTGEHKIKRTVIDKLMFENNKINSPVKLFSNNANKPQFIRSAKSDHLKYKKNLCEYCNNTRTQPFDISYDIFFKYLIENGKNIFLSNRIGLKNIKSEYDRNFSQKDLFKYFIKAFCCVIDSTKETQDPLSVPTKLIDALCGKEYGKELMIQFCSNGDFKNYPLNKIIRVSNHNLHEYNGKFAFIYCESYGWFHISYIYQDFCLTRNDTKLFKKEVENYWVGKSSEIKIVHNRGESSLKNIRL